MLSGVPERSSAGPLGGPREGGGEGVRRELLLRCSAERQRYYTNHEKPTPGPSP